MRTKNEFENSPEIGQYADVFNYLLHYYEKGDGEPLLMIHGLGQSLYTFRRNIDELSKFFRVIAVDLPGHGYSDKPEMEYTIKDITEALVVFLSVLRIEKTHIFAFSTGAVIAENMAINYPEKINRMILLSPGGINNQYPFYIKALRLPLISDIAISFGFNRKKIAKCLATAYFDRTTVSDKIVEQAFLPYNSIEARDALSTAIKNWNESEVYTHLNELLMPIYIFWGECDKWHPLSMLDEVAEMLPFAFIATVRNCGHMIHEEKSREINRKTIECLTEPIAQTKTYDDEEEIFEESNLDKIKKSFAKMRPNEVDFEG